MNNASMVPLVREPLSHPSVRIIGHENDYNPAQCSDPRCSNLVFHMHCPFCVKTELYYDARILKAHYRVKHVDKGIHFAGLKILRCCEQCDIVGAIKGEKKFKGAHWHCYKCKNGFNRRDEAVKHYKTHFRHPYTTFQIHVSQEVNNPMWCQDRKDDDADNCNSLCRTFQTTFGSKATVTSIILKNGDQPLVNESSHDEDGVTSAQVPCSSIADDMAAIVQPTEGQTAIMIVQGDQVEGAATVATGQNISDSTQPSFSTERTVMELKEEILKLQEEKRNAEVAFNVEIKHLKMKIELQDKEIEELRKHEEELLNQIMVPSDGRMQQLVTSLQVQHAQMLQDHLMQVRKEAFVTTLKELKNGTVDLSQTLQRSSIDGNQQIVAVVLQDNSVLSPNFPVSYTTCASTIDASNGVSSEPRGSQSAIGSSPISTNLLIATEMEHEKTLKSICDSCTNDSARSNRSSSKLFLVNRNQYEITQDIVAPAKGFTVSDGAECPDNFVVPSSTCGNLVVQVNGNCVEKQASFKSGLDLQNEANGNVSFLTEEQLRNCIGATTNLFSQSPSNPYHLFISQKPEPLIMREKRKLFFAECPEKKHVKNSS